VPSDHRETEVTQLRQIIPYRTLRGAKKAIDSGGRFYDLVARAGDDKVDASELARAAGVFKAGTKAFLFLEMAMADLSRGDRMELTSLMSADLQQRFRAQRPVTLPPSAVEAQGEAGFPTIVSGYPAFVEDRSQFSGFIVLVTPTVMLIPIIDHFDVYEVFDTPDMSTPRTVIATTRGSARLGYVRHRFGGVLKELQFEDKTGRKHGLYLETMYCTPLE
jgi:hypothetical protein